MKQSKRERKALSVKTYNSKVFLDTLSFQKLRSPALCHANPPRSSPFEGGGRARFFHLTPDCAPGPMLVFTRPLSRHRRCAAVRRGRSGGQRARRQSLFSRPERRPITHTNGPSGARQSIPTLYHWFHRLSNLYRLRGRANVRRPSDDSRSDYSGAARIIPYNRILRHTDRS